MLGSIFVDFLIFIKGDIMLEFKPITLEDKNVLEKYLKPYKFSTSEYSFTNLFIWRIACDIKYTVFRDVLIIKKKDFNNSYHFMQPIGYNKDNLKEIVDNLIEYKDKNNMKYIFKDAEKEFIDDIKDIYPEKFEILEDVDNFDYIYESSKLISLSGKKLHKKKNHYNNFVKNNEFRVAPIDGENICECITLAKKCAIRGNANKYLFFEVEAIKELLANRYIFNLEGMAVYVDEELSAFTLGEKVNDEMAIIHIEKADSDINGLYSFINKAFIETYFSEVPFINREQDLGIEGLRQAKQTYNPYKLEPKYAIIN